MVEWAMETMCYVKLSALKVGRTDDCVEISLLRGRIAGEKKPARRPVFHAACQLLLGGSSGSGGVSGRGGGSSSVSGSGGRGGVSSGSGGRGHVGGGSGGSGGFRSGSRSFFFFAASGQGHGEQGGEQDGIFHLSISLKRLINMLIASVFCG